MSLIHYNTNTKFATIFYMDKAKKFVFWKKKFKMADSKKMSFSTTPKWGHLSHFEKFQLLGPKRLSNFTVHLHCYLDSTLIWHLRVLSCYKLLSNGGQKWVQPLFLQFEKKQGLFWKSLSFNRILNHTCQTPFDSLKAL